MERWHGGEGGGVHWSDKGVFKSERKMQRINFGVLKWDKTLASPYPPPQKKQNKKHQVSVAQSSDARVAWAPSPRRADDGQ